MDNIWKQQLSLMYFMWTAGHLRLGNNNNVGWEIGDFSVRKWIYYTVKLQRKAPKMCVSVWFEYIYYIMKYNN